MCIFEEEQEAAASSSTNNMDPALHSPVDLSEWIQRLRLREEGLKRQRSRDLRRQVLVSHAKNWAQQQLVSVQMDRRRRWLILQQRSRQENVCDCATCSLCRRFGSLAQNSLVMRCYCSNVFNTSSSSYHNNNNNSTTTSDNDASWRPPSPPPSPESDNDDVEEDLEEEMSPQSEVVVDEESQNFDDFFTLLSNRSKRKTTKDETSDDSSADGCVDLKRRKI